MTHEDFDNHLADSSVYTLHCYKAVEASRNTEKSFPPRLQDLWGYTRFDDEEEPRFQPGEPKAEHVSVVKMKPKSVN